MNTPEETKSRQKTFIIRLWNESPATPAMNLTMVDLVNSGRTSSVCRCMYSMMDGVESTVAVKIIKEKSKAFEEISTLLMMGHPNVMSVLDIVETGDYVGIIMPLMHMDLRGFMNKVVYDVQSMIQIKIQTMRAVHHMHTRGIVHLDIKPENICVDFDYSQRQCIKISSIRCMLLDYGSSLVIGARRDLHNQLSSTEVARCFTIQTTRGYQPPELTANGSISLAGDIYSMGVVFSELINNRQADNTEILAPQADTPTLSQLSLDMQSPEFRRRPSSRDVLIRLNDSDTKVPLLLQSCSTVVWASPISNAMLNNAKNNGLCIAELFVNDRSTDIQRLVTLVHSQDANHIRCAFWMLYESSVLEVECCQASKLSVLSVLPYFENMVHLSGEYGLFYAKSLDVLSTVSHFVLSDEMRLNLWKVSSSLRACERPLIRCLERCWSDSLCKWCTSSEKKWGVLHDTFLSFITRFLDDWDLLCAEAARRLVDLLEWK